MNRFFYFEIFPSFIKKTLTITIFEGDTEVFNMIINTLPSNFFDSHDLFETEKNNIRIKNFTDSLEKRTSNNIIFENENKPNNFVDITFIEDRNEIKFFICNENNIIMNSFYTTDECVNQFTNEFKKLIFNE